MKRIWITYNNSQNAINEKTFTAAQDVFKLVQSEFEWRGFLVCIKQSDKHTFQKKYKTPTVLLNKCNKDIVKFGLENRTKTKDFFIELEKLLQVILAFIGTPQDAVQNKSKLLKDQSVQNQKVIDFIKDPVKTQNDLFNLTLLYLRAEQEKKKDGRFPNPFYTIYGFAHYDCKDNPAKISELLDSKEKIDTIIKKYALTNRWYYRDWIKQNNGKEYNDMIKSPIDIAILIMLYL